MCKLVIFLNTIKVLLGLGCLILRKYIRYARTILPVQQLYVYNVLSVMHVSRLQGQHQ